MLSGRTSRIGTCRALSLGRQANGLEIGGLDREAMRLGLDLKGGTYVLLEADTSDVDDVDQALRVTRDIIEGRVNRFGVSESEIPD